MAAKGRLPCRWRALFWSVSVNSRWWSSWAGERGGGRDMECGVMGRGGVIGVSGLATFSRP